MPNVLMLPYGDENPYQVLLSRALEAEGFRVKGVGYNWRLAAKVREHAADVIHLHWLHPWATGCPWWKFWLRLPAWVAQLLWLRWRGKRLVWTAHNLVNHERRAVLREWVFTWLTTLCCHAVIAHSRQAAARVARRFALPRGKVRVVLHGNYLGWYPDTMTRDEARAALGISNDRRVFLLFGAIRRYKRVLEFMDAFNASAREGDLLLVVGRARPEGYGAEVAQRCRDSARLRYDSLFVPDGQVQRYMRAADVVVFPYAEALTSGAVILAMGFGRPCLVPDDPCFREVPGDGGAFFFPAGCPIRLGPAMDRIRAAAGAIETMGEHNRRAASQLGWEAIGRETARTFAG